MLPGHRSVCAAALCVIAAGAALAQSKAPAKGWAPPKTPWGDPDLQGTWTSDDSFGVPLERPHAYGDRKFLTDEEFAARQKENELVENSIQKGVTPKAGYWLQHQGVDYQPYSSSWSEYARHTTRQTSLIVDPPNGRLPPATQAAMMARMAAVAEARRRPRPESWEDINMFGRCITRGVIGSMLPVMYGNGTDILQSPGLVVIRSEMIHETRIVPIDPPDHPRPHLPAALRTYMGDPRGHWEGNTLVVETTNFIGGKVGIGEDGAGLKYSDALKLVERFTRTSDKSIQYELTVNDPKTFTAPWTVAFPINEEPGYQIYEYACHEGNYAMADILSGARAEEAREAAQPTATTK